MVRLSMKDVAREADMNKLYWWSCYCNARPGVHNLPHFGDVILYFLVLKGMSKRDFAIRIDKSERYVDMLTSESNIDMPKTIARREALAKILGIPAILLGLPFIEADGNLSPVNLDTRHLQVYDDMLKMGWSVFWTGDFQGATQNIQVWLDVLKDTENKTTGIERDQFKAMRCRFLNLASIASLDRMQNRLALQRINEAVTLAKELNNIELTALSLYRRIRIFLPLEKTDEAIADVDQALQHEDALSDDIRGVLYLVAGEAIANKAKQDKSLQTVALAHLDKSANIARKIKGAPDTHSLSFSLTPVMNERAATFSLFGMKSDARNSLIISRKELEMNNVRWSKDLFLAEAATSLYTDEDVTSTATALLSTVKISDVTHSKSNLPYIMRRYEKCLTIEPNNATLGKLGDALGV